MTLVDILAILAAAVAGVCSALTRLNLHRDWKHLSSAGINGEVEHVVRGLKRTASLRAVGSGVILAGVAFDAHAAVVLLSLAALAASASDWRDRKVSKLMAAIRHHAVELRGRR